MMNGSLSSSSLLSFVNLNLPQAQVSRSLPSRRRPPKISELNHQILLSEPIPQRNSDSLPSPLRCPHHLHPLQIRQRAHSTPASVRNNLSCELARSHPGNLQRSTKLCPNATRGPGEVVATGNVEGSVCVDESGGFAAYLYTRAQEWGDGVEEWVVFGWPLHVEDFYFS